ncbi:sporulation protein YpjB [Terribacillus sp. 179-K 1B1 HS]|uniref:Sporulation protein YpjB (SpoYpjB) n=1 Tax=Terribacillus halophilus TaxID=361279 RepID=A0A1G6V2Z8_9BACI|nr:sporulation protein YpjB [Terribacillus halophilus]SDD47999.1 Sporulation protein YpjB (SpoYpjB) [Terribacillus halophilus]
MKKLLLVVVLTASFFVLANIAELMLQPQTEALSSSSDKMEQTFDQQFNSLPAYLYSIAVPDKSSYGTGRFWGILGISASIVGTLIYVGYKKYRAENDKSVNKDPNS